MPPPPRRAVRRTLSFPPAIKNPSNGPGSAANQSPTVFQAPIIPPPPTKPLENVHSFTDFDEHPEDVFLSPMHEYEYEYDDWASDSDDEDDDGDDDDFDWDAGITDFALFDNDRRQAQQSKAPIDSRWEDFMSRQQSALQRALVRTRAEDATYARPHLSADEPPALTPDTSPDLHDDLDVESQVADKPPQQQQQPRPLTPTTKGPGNALTITITPPSPSLDPVSDEHVDEDALFPSPLDISPSPPKYQPARPSPLRSSVTFSPQPLPSRHVVQRPGLRHARTLSGKLHSWRRPSWHIYRVDEEQPQQSASASERDGLLRRVDGWEDLRGRRM